MEFIFVKFFFFFQMFDFFHPLKGTIINLYMWLRPALLSRVITKRHTYVLITVNLILLSRKSKCISIPKLQVVKISGPMSCEDEALDRHSFNLIGILMLLLMMLCCRRRCCFCFCFVLFQRPLRRRQYNVTCFSSWCNSSQWAKASPLSRLHDHTQTQHTR
jgi:hypothetical protein